MAGVWRADAEGALECGRGGRGVGALGARQARQARKGRCREARLVGTRAAAEIVEREITTSELSAPAAAEEEE